jgi:Flp pilus assembly protein CpaB
MTYRLRNIVLAVVLAILAAALTAIYVANYQNRVDEGHELVKVFVAKSDIAPGTPTGALEGKVTQQEIQKKSITPAVVYDLQSLDGKTTSQWIYAGEQLSARRFSITGRSGIHAELKGNYRAFGITGTEQQLLAGVIKAGDHVDIVANFKTGEGNVTRMLLRDIRVLRAPQSAQIDSKLSSPTGNVSAVLEVTDTQAQKLFFVTAGNEDHEWWLDLRAPTDSTDSPESVTTIVSVVRDGLPANMLGRTSQLDTEGNR